MEHFDELENNPKYTIIIAKHVHSKVLICFSLIFTFPNIYLAIQLFSYLVQPQPLEINKIIILDFQSPSTGLLLEPILSDISLCL